MYRLVPVFTIVNSTTVNILIYTSVRVCLMISLGQIAKCGITKSDEIHIASKGFENEEVWWK